MISDLILRCNRVFQIALRGGENLPVGGDEKFLLGELFYRVVGT